MTDSKNRTSIGRGLLLSVVLTAVPLAGCDTVFYPPGQQAMYTQVVTTKDPALAGNFIRMYPDSPLVRNVLLSLPPSSLKRLSKDAVARIPPETLKTLPADIVTLLGTAPPKPTTIQRKRPGGYDG